MGRGGSTNADETRRLELDALKLENELKRLDLQLRARAQEVADEELALKRLEVASSRWRNPLVVAVLAAAVAGLSNAGVAFMNGVQQRALEKEKAQLEQGLELSKAESALILEVIKTGGNPDRAADNLNFLLDAGLIASKERVDYLRRYLDTRGPGQGVTLPTAAGGNRPFQIDPGDAVSGDAKSVLERRLNTYVSYLGRLGFRTDGKVQIRFEEGARNAYIVPEERRIVIDPVLAEDTHAPLWTMTEHLLLENKPGLKQDYSYTVVDAALSDYFSSSFLDDPRVGQVAASATDPDRFYFRNLNNNLCYEEITSCRRSSPHEQAEVWGGALWAIRGRLGAPTTDRLLQQAFRRLPPAVPKGHFPDALMEGILEASRATLDPERAGAVEEVFRKRGFPLSDMGALPCEEGS